jgi:hypothetical protein
MHVECGLGWAGLNKNEKVVADVRFIVERKEEMCAVCAMLISLGEDVMPWWR